LNRWDFQISFDVIHPAGWVWRPTGMTAPLSNDLRARVVRAIEGGLSRRAAAAKFDVSIASAVRWYQRYKRRSWRRTAA
jgi:hypothetical protein